MTVIETEERETSSQLEWDSAMTTGGCPHFPAPSVFSGSAKQGDEQEQGKWKPEKKVKLFLSVQDTIF